MSRTKKSEFVKAAGTSFEIVSALANAVMDRGGSDDDLRRILSDKELAGKLADLLVSGKTSKTLAQMIAAGRYDWVDQDITEERFPVNPERFTTAGIKVYHFNKVMRTEDVVAEMAKDGYEPAFVEHLLARGAEDPEEQRRYPVVALGSSCLGRDGSRHVPGLAGRGRRRGLRLDWFGRGWSEYCRFLAVRKS